VPSHGEKGLAKRPAIKERKASRHINPTPPARVEQKACSESTSASSNAVARPEWESPGTSMGAFALTGRKLMNVNLWVQLLGAIVTLLCQLLTLRHELGLPPIHF
jgi:hypothetical protein